MLHLLEGGHGVGVSVHVAGPAFHASRFEGGEVERIEGDGGAWPTGVATGSLNDVFMLI